MGDSAGPTAAHRRPTLQDVANAASVSIATASRVLSGSANVGNITRQRVLEEALRLGYQVNSVARSTASGSHPVVALIGDDVVDPVFAKIASGLVDEADRARLLVMMAGTMALGVVPAMHHTLEYRPRAVVVASRQVPSADLLMADPVVDRYLRRGGGLAVVGEGTGTGQVLLEDAAGAQGLARLLVESGYRRPLLLMADASFTVLASRAEILERSLTRAGLDAPARLMARGVGRDAGYEAVQEWAGGARGEIDVVVAVTDTLAIGAMTGLRDHGVRPGVDIGVTGFDGIPAARDVLPGLTTVDTSLDLAGRAALSMVLAGAESRVETPPARVVPRDSTPRR